MRVLSAQGIVAVAAAEGECVACGILSGAHVDVVAAAQPRHAEEVVVHLPHAFLVACGIVHAANHAVTEASEFEVVHVHAVQVGTAVEVVVASDAEPHGTEGVAHLVEVGVFLGRDGRNRLLGIVVLVELTLREGEVGIIDCKAVGRRLRRGPRCHSKDGCH